MTFDGFSRNLSDFAYITNAEWQVCINSDGTAELFEKGVGVRQRFRSFKLLADWLDRYVKAPPDP
jgi:HKD family nuclease